VPPWLGAFLGRAGSIRAAWATARAFPSPLGHRATGFATLRSLPAWRGCPPGPTPRRPPIAHHGRHRDGTSNPLSITYASRPRLRPASPAADQPGCGTLGHPVGGIRTPLALLVPTFALPHAPGSLPLPLHRRGGRSPTTEAARRQGGKAARRRSVCPSVRLSVCPSPRSAASVPGLAPVDCRRRGTAPRPPCPLSPDFGTLADGLGCSPLDHET